MAESPYHYSSWPGGPQPPGYDPLMAIAPTLGRQPMFDAQPGPRFTGPFNAGTSHDAILNMMMPALLQMLSGNRKVPTQFFPEQNVYDQMQANNYYKASQAAMSMASSRDAQSVEKMINGVTQMMTGQPLTNMQTARNFKIAQGVSQFTPMLTQMLGPDLVDQLHGSRGSATVFAQQLHQALRTGIDPITHTPGYSGESAGRLSQEVFENLYGNKADVGAMKGISAGQAGILLNELQSRGMLGRPMGMLSINEQRSILPSSLSDDTVNRLAEQLPEIQKVLKDGGTPSEKMLAAARTSIRDTHSKLRDPQVDMTAKDLEKLPGGQEIIRAGDADRITQRLKNMAGAVKAMRDIFGDMGNPNAPMREILNGLEALTQGGMSHMSAGELESMVRRTHNIAKQTGIGVNNLVGMTTENAALADRLGLNRIFAANAANQGALYGAAAGDQLRLDMPAWGALSKEQLTLGDQQLRMHAAASPLANQLNAGLRMADAGMLQSAKPDSELSAYIQAVRQGDTRYKFDGKEIPVIMPHARFMQMLERDAGVNGTSAYAILNDIKGNQEAGNKYNTTETVRRIQPDEIIRKTLRPTLGNRVRGMLTDTGMEQTLRDAGVITSDEDLRNMSMEIGAGIGNDFFAMDAATVNNPAAKQRYLGEAYKNQLRAAIAKKMPNATPEQIDAVLTAAMAKNGGETGKLISGATLQSTINQVASQHPLFKSDIGMYGLANKKVMNQAAARGRQAEMATLMQTAMSGLGTGGPMQRLMDVLQNAGPNTSLRDVASDALGSVSADAIAAADPNGPLAQVFGLVQANNAMDPNDPRQMDQARRNAAIVQAIVNGGAAAEEQLKLLDTDPTNKGNALLRKHLENAKNRGTDSNMLGVMGYQLGANVSMDQVNAMRDNGRDLMKLLADPRSTEGERNDAASTFVNGSYTRGRDLLQDERSMEIIGHGGLDLIQQTMDASSKLQDMADAQSKALKRKISIADLLQGANGVSAETKAAAGELHNTLNTNWDEISRRRGFAVLPGQGDDPENKKRAAMSDQERSELREINEFEAHNATADERATAVIDQLASIATPDQRQRLKTDVNRKALQKALTDGDRSVSVHRALHSRQAILEMGLKKGIFGDKTKLSELTDDEEQSAIDKLESADLSDVERGDLKRLRRHASGVMNFGDSDTQASDIMGEAMNIAKHAAPAGNAPLPSQQTPEIKVTVTGSVTQRDDGKLDLDLGGMGTLLEQAAGLLGIR